MMNSLLLALLLCLWGAVPTLAAGEASGSGYATQTRDPKPMVHPHAQMMQAMSGNPQHLLAMGYHKNLLRFGRMLQQVVRQGDAVPPDFARAAVTEMRRSADQMEIYHEQAARTLPKDVRDHHAEMQKQMAAHLEQVRSQLAQLDTLTKADRIDSGEVLKRLDLLFQGCQAMGHQGACGDGMPGKGCAGERRDCGCDRDYDHHPGMGQRGGCGECREFMQQRRQMMQQMKQQDAQISQLTARMNAATGEQKQALMAEIITRMVQQHEAMSVHLEKLQRHQGQHAAARGQAQSRQDGTEVGQDLDQDDQDGMDDEDFDDSDIDKDDGMDMQDMRMNPNQVPQDLHHEMQH
jgi:hypothetical protein